MTVANIIETWLKENGYDGLYCPGECACKIGDLIPCDSEGALNCEPGVRQSEDVCRENGYDFMIGPRADKEGQKPSTNNPLCATGHEAKLPPCCDGEICHSKNKCDAWRNFTKR
jgi:hypothetical protein